MGRGVPAQGQPGARAARHDFMDKEPRGRRSPTGVYDVTANAGVGVSGRPSIMTLVTFAAESVRRWWKADGVGPPTPEPAGSPDHRGRLRVQQLPPPAGRTEIAALAPWRPAWPITVCHFPPGTSKWNKFEHPLFFSPTSR